MAGALDIQRRIKSIKNTRKVTKAMEIVSAAKMKKAVSQVTALRPYALAMQEVFESVAPHVQSDHPLLANREAKNILMIVIASNKGLCGGFNSAIAKVVRRAVDDGFANKSRGASSDKISKDHVSCITVGRKADAMMKRLGLDLLATFPELNYAPDSAAVAPLIQMVTEGFAEGKYDKVFVVYTDYVNPIVQEQKLRQVLPVSSEDLRTHIAEMEGLDNEKHVSPAQYAVEPSPEEVITTLMPRVLESQILHALFESNASKESARMIAMKNATDAAGDIIDDLTLAYNKMRQAKITQEISEISAGRAALE